MPMKCHPTISLDPSHPLSTWSFDPADENLAEMIQTIFPLDTDDAVLNWGGVSFALNYKYDVSLMIQDLLELSVAISLNQKGKQGISFVTTGFPYHWDVEWGNAHIRIRAFANDPSSTNAKSIDVIETSIDYFLDLWRPMFQLIHAAAVQSGYDVNRFPSGECLLRQNPS